MITPANVAPIFASVRNTAELVQPTRTVVPSSGHALVQPVWVALHDGDVDAFEQPVQLLAPI